MLVGVGVGVLVGVKVGVLVGVEVGILEGTGELVGVGMEVEGGEVGEQSVSSQTPQKPGISI